MGSDGFIRKRVTEIIKEKTVFFESFISIVVLNVERFSSPKVSRNWVPFSSLTYP